MNELSREPFDYSALDVATAEYLKDRENSMSKTLEDAAEKLGEDLYKAQQKLSRKGYGCFEEWYTSLGLKKRSVYNYIDRYSFVQNLHNQNEIEIFQELAPSLQNEMAKPSAREKVNQAVFDGDIKTRKEYIELERRFKQLEEELEQTGLQLDSTKVERNVLKSKLEAAESAQPEVIEKEVIKEVIPEEIKQQVEEYKAKVARESKSAESLRNELKKYTEAFSDPQQAYDEKEERRLERESNINAYKLAISIQKFIENNAVETYKVSSVIRSNETAKQRLQEHVDLLKDFTDQLESILNARIITK